MKKVSHSDPVSTTEINLCDTINPQQSEHKCKICYEEKMPLVALCQCTGSIAYVHEECILDWIALKMEKSDVIEIPKCEICKVSFSAALKIGSKRIDSKLLLQKMRGATKKDWLLFSGSMIAFFVAFITIIISIIFFAWGDLFKFDSFGILTFSLVKLGFLHIFFPTMFIKERMEYFKEKWKLVDSCKVQLVEVTLLPKKMLKI